MDIHEHLFRLREIGGRPDVHGDALFRDAEVVVDEEFRRVRLARGRLRLVEVRAEFDAVLHALPRLRGAGILPPELTDGLRHERDALIDVEPVFGISRDLSAFDLYGRLRVRFFCGNGGLLRLFRLVRTRRKQNARAEDAQDEQQ